jgi:2-keto-4-pentenoate hydratase
VTAVVIAWESPPVEQGAPPADIIGSDMRQQPDSTFDTAGAAQRLVRAHKGATLAPHAQVTPPDTARAYAVQDLVARGLGPVGGWKVGAAGPAAEPACAPLLAAGIFKSGAALVGPPWRTRGVEVEVALRLGHDLVLGNGDNGPLEAARVIEAVDAILPAVEIIETRLDGWRESKPLAQLADLQNHGGLVVGEPSPVDVRAVDLRTVEAYLAFDGQPVASTRGANPAADIWRLVGWLAWHCAQRGMPLRAGQVITTGSCSGVLFAPEGAFVQAQLAGIGQVELRF